MPDTEILLARHGETEWSRDGRHTGLTDVPLTDTGREQARALASRFAGLQPALVLSSPLSRALETCRLAGLGEQAAEEPDLVEWDYGDYEGITTEEIRENRPGWSIFEDGAPGGESPEQIGARADRVIERLEAADGLAVAFAHGHILRVLAARWVGLPAAGGRYLALSTATLSALGRERETRVVTLWNDGSHLT
jgi:probable phosphoglycerate mutase